jgi:hypothetical protein
MGKFSKVIKEDDRIQLSHLPVAGQSMSSVLVQPLTSTMASFEDGNCPASESISRDAGDKAGNSLLFVPVQDKNGKPLMPTHPARARELVRKGKAVRRFLKGLFYIRLVGVGNASLNLHVQPIQPISCGIDPGSKKEAFSVKSAKHTYLNLQSDAITWVSDALKSRSEMRRSRRYRKTPYRANRQNRSKSKGTLPPSTKARWDWKLRIASWLSQLYPISVFIVEDVKAKSRGKKRWDKSFSPLEVGKEWFYKELSRMAEVRTKSGWETKLLRDQLGLKKSANKMADVFESHAVDSWVLASSEVGGKVVDNKCLLLVIPLRFHRRQLQLLNPTKGGYRRDYGGTRSLGYRRGSMVKHPKYGVLYVGGASKGKGRISLHSLSDGQRLCQNAKPSDCKFLAYSSWRVRAA